MEFQSRVEEEVHGRVTAWIAKLFGASAKPTQDARAHRVSFGSAFVEVSVATWGDKEAVVVARAPVVSGTDVTPDLMRYLLRKNADTRFGAFAITDAGDIELRYAMVGSTCQEGELRAAVQYLMLAADLCDDEIVSRWGGLRARDRG
jgi:hypothetical protein